MLHSHVTQAITYEFAKIIMATCFHLTPSICKSDFALEEGHQTMPLYAVHIAQEWGPITAVVKG